MCVCVGGGAYAYAYGVAATAWGRLLASRRSYATPRHRRDATPPPRPQARTLDQTIRLLLLQMSFHVLRRRQAHNRVDGKIIINPLVRFQRGYYRCGVRETRRLEHDGVELLSFLY